MSSPSDIVIAEFQRAGFLVVTCCNETIGAVNARVLTPQANDRIAEIFARCGETWTDDPEAHALLTAPISHAPPADGTPILFQCNTCNARFVWVGGVPTKVRT